MQQQPLIGKRADNVTVAPVIQADQFGETPIFALGEVNPENPYLKQWPVGGVLAGTLKALRTTKAEDPNDARDYACLETADGIKFRCYTPGQLKWNLSQLAIGTYVEMTYMGKEKVDGFKAPLHQFKVEAANAPSLN